MFVEDMSFKNEIKPEHRKIVGIIVILAGLASIFFVNMIVGILVLLTGMWIFNPKKKGDSGDQKGIPAWLGGIILVLVLVGAFWIFIALG